MLKAGTRSKNNFVNECYRLIEIFWFTACLMLHVYEGYGNHKLMHMQIVLCLLIAVYLSNFLFFYFDPLLCVFFFCQVFRSSKYKTLINGHLFYFSALEVLARKLKKFSEGSNHLQDQTFNNNDTHQLMILKCTCYFGGVLEYFNFSRKV